MAGKYWDRAWSLVDGCTPCSPGCDHCWSMAMAKRFKKWPDRITVRPDRLDIPLKTRKSTVFSVWNDLFHEDVPDEFRDKVFGMIANYGKHTFLVLTKRADQMFIYFSNQWRWALIEGAAQKIYYDKYHDDPSLWFAVHDLPNLWLGVTVCNQQEADEKIPLLLQTPAAHRWVNIEPMLGEIDLNDLVIKEANGEHHIDCLECDVDPIDDPPFYGSTINAIILGGETGSGARPLYPDWVRKARDDCAVADVNFFFKQWGKFEEHDAQTFAEAGYNFHLRNGGRLLDGREHNELPWRKTA